MAVANNNEMKAIIYAKKLLLTSDHNGEDEMKMVDMSYEKLMKDGNALSLPKMGDVTLNNGVSIVHSSPSVTSTEVQVDQFYNFSIPISMIDQIQIKGFDLKKLWQGRADVAIDDVRAETILGLYASAGLSVAQTALTKNNICDWVADVADALYVGKAVNSAGMSVASNEFPYLMLAPGHIKLLDKAPDLKKSTDFAEQVLQNGVKKQVKLINGLRIFKSTRFTTVGGVYYNMAGIPEAIAYASQIQKQRIIQDGDDWNDKLQGLIGFMCKVVNGNHIVNAPTTIA
jgi:hypothetical protein